LVDLKFRPSDPYVLNNAGLAYINAGRFREAEELVQQALSINPRLVPARANLARIYMHSGDFGKARSVYRQILDIDPQNRVALMNMAELSVLAQDLDEAESLFTSVVRQDIHDANSAAAWNNRGVVRMLRGPGRLHEAIADLRAAVRADVRDAPAHSNLGVAYALVKNTRKAVQAFKTALTVDPLDEAATKNLAQLELSTGQVESAISRLTKYLQIRSDDLEASNLLARAYVLFGKYDLGVQQLRAALSAARVTSSEQKAAMLNDLGVALALRGEIDEAREFFEKSIEAKPDELLARHNLIRTFLDHRDLSQAKEKLDQCLTIAPDDPATLTLMGAYYAFNEEYQSSLAVLEHALAKDPRHVQAYAWLTCVLGDIFGDFDQIVRRLLPMLDHYPHDATIVNNLAYAYLMLNDVPAARNLLDRLNQTLYADHPIVTATRGLLLLKEGNVEEGRRLYNLAANLAKTDELKQLIRQKKNLELAHHYVRVGSTEIAKRLLQEAVSMKTIDSKYRRRAAALLRQINEPDKLAPI